MCACTQVLQEHERLQAKQLDQSYQAFKQAAEAAAAGRTLQPGSGRLPAVPEDGSAMGATWGQSLTTLAGTGVAVLGTSAQAVSAAAQAAISAAQPVIRATQSVAVDLTTLRLSHAKRQRSHASSRGTGGMVDAAAAAVAAVDTGASRSAGGGAALQGPPSARSTGSAGGSMAGAQPARTVAPDI